MIALIRTNNPITLSFAQSLLKDSSIESFVADTHMSVLEGSVGAIQRRLMVLEEDLAAATRVMEQAGLAAELLRQ
jgi:putative signal transducing protein